jgi:hypothetical protein
MNIHEAEIQTPNYHVRIRGTTVKEERRSVNKMEFIPFETAVTICTALFNVNSALDFRAG